jgi:hypothetical protein
MGEKRNWQFIMSAINTKADHKKEEMWNHFILLGVSPNSSIDDTTKSEKFTSDTTITQLADLIAKFGKENSFIAKVEAGKSTMALDSVNYLSDNGDNTKFTFTIFLAGFDANKIPPNLTPEGNLAFMINNYSGGVMVMDATISRLWTVLSADPTPPVFYSFDGKKTELFAAGQRLSDIFKWWRK